MIGTIIGDMVCSSIEPGGRLPGNRKLFDGECKITANTVMFLAVAKSLMEYSGKSYDLIDKIKENSGKLMESVFGEQAGNMVFSRIACNMPVAFFARNYKEVHDLTFIVVPAIAGSSVDDVFAAEIETASVFRYLHFHPVSKLKKALLPKKYVFPESTGRYLSEYEHSFRESLSFEDAIRKASATSDPCNMAAIVGAIAEPYHGVPESFRLRALEILGPDLGSLFEETERSALPKVSTYIPDLTKPSEVHYMPARFTSSKWEYFKKRRGEKSHGKV